MEGPGWGRARLLIIEDDGREGMLSKLRPLTLSL